MTVALTRASLAGLGPPLGVPAYDPGALRGGIVHFGVGNFHRAHQAVYLDDLFATGRDLDWALVGAGVRAPDAALRDDLARQDWLTTVVAQEAEGATARVTAAMVDYLPVGDAAAIVARLADPAIRIVSLTITEGGYCIDPATQRFDPTHPEIVADARTPEAPVTVFGLILAGLRQRRAAGLAPFTVMSCDNIPGNGAVTRNAVAGLAELHDHRLADWVRGHVAFPNGMVDRITPATTARERALIEERYGLTDRRPVFCEGFRQWVLEDSFPAGRPALEMVGVEFVPDVAPFEHMKIRILNGGHAAIAYPAALLDIGFAHEAMAQPLIRAYLDKLEHDEILPVVPPVPHTDLAAYAALVARRIANPAIGDTIARLCLDGANRQPKFILPTAADRLARGLGVTGLALASAFWARYCYGTTESGRAIAPNDARWPHLTETARRARTDPAAWLAMTDIFGDLGRHPAYAKAFVTALDSIWTTGTAATLDAYLGNRL